MYVQIVTRITTVYQTAKHCTLLANEQNAHSNLQNKEQYAIFQHVMNDSMT